MKKTVNKFLAVMVVFVLCLTPIQLSAAQPYVLDYETASPFDLLAAERGVEFATNYVRTLTMLNNFIDSLPVSRTGELMFPDYFGGAYIDGDGNAVLLMVDMPIASPVLEGRGVVSRTISEHIEQMQTSEGVTVRQVEFAYSALWAAIHLLNDLIPPTLEDMAAANAGGWYLDVVNNRVVVELVDFTEDAVTVFRETVLDVPLIAFTQSDGPMVLEMPEYDYENTDYLSTDELAIIPFNTSVAHVGQQINVRRNGVIIGNGSIGYRASASGGIGFVTAAHLGLAHGGLQFGDSIYLPWRSTRIGRVAAPNHVILSGSDSAFITLDPGLEITSFSSGHFINGSTTHLWRGQYVASNGFISGSRSGNVTTFGLREIIQCDITGVSFLVMNAMNSTIGAARGDSGGIVYCLHTNAAVGIISGGSSTRSVTSTVAEINVRIRAVAR